MKLEENPSRSNGAWPGVRKTTSSATKVSRRAKSPALTASIQIESTVRISLSSDAMGCLGPKRSAPRWGPAADARIARTLRRADIRWSVWLGHLAVGFGTGPALQKGAQCVRLIAQFTTFDAPNGKNRRKLLIQLR